MSSVLVRLGDLDTISSTACSGSTSAAMDCSSPQDYPIDNVVYHSDYDTPKYSNDIALIRLRRPTGGGGADAPVALCLPIGGFADGGADNHYGIVAGWGATNAGTGDGGYLLGSSAHRSLAKHCEISLRPSEQMCERVFSVA